MTSPKPSSEHGIKGGPLYPPKEFYKFVEESDAREIANMLYQIAATRFSEDNQFNPLLIVFDTQGCHLSEIAPFFRNSATQEIFPRYLKTIVNYAQPLGIVLILSAHNSKSPKEEELFLQCVLKSGPMYAITGRVTRTTDGKIESIVADKFGSTCECTFGKLFKFGSLFKHGVLPCLGSWQTRS